jgi:flagellar biosynthetic protein FliQ
LTEAFVLKIAKESLMTTLLIISPAIGVGLIVGLVISILQAATQVQEQTLTFVPKIVAIFITLFITASWMMNILISFTADVFSQLPGLVR